MEIEDDGQNREHLKEENDQEREQGVGIKRKRKNICTSCIEVISLASNERCQSCEKELPKASFSPSQWKRPAQDTRSCKDCCCEEEKENNYVEGATDLKQCSACKVLLKEESFSKRQWKGNAEKVRCCKECR